MAPPVVFDLLRLFLGPTSPTPRGIDRVDLAYARYLFTNWTGDCMGLLPTAMGMRLYDRKWVLRCLDAVEAQWREVAQGSDAGLAEVARRLESPAGRSPDPRHPLVETLLSASGFVRLLTATGLGLGRSAVRVTPAESIYLNIGQLGWAAPLMVSWLRRRPDIRPVFMLHDAIPIERPELVTPMGCTAHQRMMRTAAHHAAGLIFTSRSAAASVERVLKAYNQPIPMTMSLHLPVAPCFLAPVEHDPALTEHTYFLVVGAIEARKNLTMLRNVWAELHRRRGVRAPKLVIAGRPGRGGRPILSQLQDAEAAGQVIVASGLSSPALHRLIAHARALLMPSSAEGFGLPIIEALAVGTPVLASDLPPHREVGGNRALYLDPTDEPGWLREVGRLADEPSTPRDPLTPYAGMTHAAYFRQVGDFLQRLR
jgi:glycosyltransferase involved in cell wall biosynthesis